jgi:hypothetical protein
MASIDSTSVLIATPVTTPVAISVATSRNTRREPLVFYGWDRNTNARRDDAKLIRTIMYSYEKTDTTVVVRYGASIFRKTNPSEVFSNIKQGVLMTVRERYTRYPVEFTFTYPDDIPFAGRFRRSLNNEIKKRIIKQMAVSGVKSKTVIN